MVCCVFFKVSLVCFNVVCWCLLLRWISIFFFFIVCLGIKLIFVILLVMVGYNIIEWMVLVLFIVFIFCVLFINLMGLVIISFVCLFFINCVFVVGIIIKKRV